MAWFLAIVALVISLWVVSLSRILSSSVCVPSTPPFLRTGSSKKRNILLVIAHPDDESMFFSPTILFLNAEVHNIHILCMSTGNADGIGNSRKEEIYRACAVLKIPLQQVKVLDHPGLQDGFKKKWDHELLARLIEDAIKAWVIDSLITFDDFGVSGHPNHCAVHQGIRRLLADNKQKDIEAWELFESYGSLFFNPVHAGGLPLNPVVVLNYVMVSQSIFRKYTGPADVWLSIISSSFYPRRQVYCLINNHPSTSFIAMAEHESQWVWFRKLFVLFSSYTYMNTLKQINWSKNTNLVGGSF